LAAADCGDSLAALSVGLAGLLKTLL